MGRVRPPSRSAADGALRTGGRHARDRLGARRVVALPVRSDRAEHHEPAESPGLARRGRPRAPLRHRSSRPRPAGSHDLRRAPRADGRLRRRRDLRLARNGRRADLRLLRWGDRRRVHAAGRHPARVSVHLARHRGDRRPRTEPARHHRGHRCLELGRVRARRARRGALPARARVRPGGARPREPRRPRPRAPHPAERLHAVARRRDARHGTRDRDRVGAVLPGARSPATDADVGRDARRRPRLHLDRVVVGDVPWPGHSGHRARDQSLR